MTRLALLSTLLLAFHAPGARAQHPAVQAAIDAVNIDSLILDLRQLDGEAPIDLGNGPQSIVSRNKNQPGNPLAADWLQLRMQQLGFEPTLQVFSGGTGENIIAEKPGALHPERKVIICGHYDAMPGGPVAAPAADDDGSGTVAVLEAMRVLRDITFENTLVFALWDEEEQGKLGSIYYAGVAAASDVEITGVVNMDAIAYDGDGDGLMRIHTKNIANSIAIKDSALMVNSTYGLNLNTAINLPGATYSDHASFWNENYGAILVIEDFDNDGNPHYHTTTDLVEYLDQPYFQGLARLSIGTAAVLAKPYASVPNAVVASGATESGAYAWPNPTHGPVRVARTRTDRPATVQLVDPLGRVVEEQRLGSGQRLLDLDLSARVPGTYEVRVLDATGVGCVRVMRLP
ncbi:MAG: M20/M25/M40 family metallo-hydrolase [Flavobacteriales bacterium]